MPAAPRTIDVRLGRYEIVRRLVRGELAELWLARDPEDRHVVIKQIRSDRATDRDFVQSFLTEARGAGTLHHQHIVRVEDVGEDRGHYYLTMEYVHGESLRRILARLHERQQPLPLPHLLAIIGAVASALHHAHEVRGTRPAGIAPGNILVGYDGHVKVCDLGIAKVMQQAAKGRSLALKVPYMAPEECTGQPVDRRTDVFALGIVLYEAVTGRRLFKASSEVVTKNMIAHGIVPRPSHHRKGLPPPLEAVIMKALARLPAQRYQTVEELRLALEPIAAKHATEMTPSALATYMKELFDRRPEPWLDTKELVVAPLDFDGNASGIAMPPAAALTGIPAPVKPPPLTSKPTDEITAVDAVPVALEAAREPTTVVSPLPIEGTIRSPHKLGRRRRLMYLAAGALIAMAGAIVFVAMTDPTPPHAAPQVAIETDHAKPAPPRDPAPPPEPAAIPWEKRTWANTEAATTGSPPPEPAPTEAAPVAEPAPVPALKEHAAPAPHHKTMARATKPAVKPAVKPSAKPKNWDPNALFYGKKP